MEKKNQVNIESIWSYKLNKKMSKEQNIKFVDAVEKILASEVVKMLKNTEQRINEETEDILGVGAIKLDIKFIDVEESAKIYQSVKMHK